MGQWQLGPVIFREELRYYREVNMLETVELHTAVQTLSEDGRKFTLSTEFRSPENELLARVEVDGAWLNLTTRRVTALPPEALSRLLPAAPPSQN
jgi:acyl-CoA thioester hydrolase